MLAILLARNALNVVWPLLGGNRWALRAADRFGLVFMGLAWLVYVLGVEAYYRRGITAALDRRDRAREQGGRPARAVGLSLLGGRFVRSMVPSAALAAVAYLAQQIVILLVAG